MSMELKACREALKSGNKPAADELLCIKEFSMEQVKAIEEKDGRIICVLFYLTERWTEILTP